MSTPEVIIVGSGPAGVMSAWGLRGRSVQMLDVGNTPPDAPRLDDNLYRLRAQRDLTSAFIGAKFEGLRNLRGRPISAKLKATPDLSLKCLPGPSKKNGIRCGKVDQVNRMNCKGPQTGLFASGSKL